MTLSRTWVDSILPTCHENLFLVFATQITLKKCVISPSILVASPQDIFKQIDGCTFRNSFIGTLFASYAEWFSALGTQRRERQNIL